MNPIHRTTMLAAVLALAPGAGQAGFNFGGKAGTLGIGAEVGYRVTEHVNFRAGLNYLNYSGDREISDIDYDFELGLRSLSLLADFYPRGRGLHLTAGFIVNANEFEAVANPVDPVTIGNTTYTPDELGELGGNVDFSPVAPYLGLGWSSGDAEGFGIGFGFGVVFQGLGDVTLEVDGPITQQPGFEADRRREEDDLEDKLGLFKLYPVLELGAVYRF